ncbi:MAG: hypothetical protein HC898_02625 [Phycisphaerales bacterium]|nr:hypothetical protein [Phycisphaerales bacterium]
MSQSIVPGTKVQIKLVKSPTSAAAKKTIVRLLRKDAAVMGNADRLRKARKTHTTEHPRGGRMWSVRVPAIEPVQLTPGTTGTIVASLDVLTDLKSIARFVEVTPA